MRIRRAFIFFTLLPLTVLAGGTPASAGGSWLVPERSAYVPAEIAVYHGSFGSGSLEGTIADGPYIAYLLPESRWIEDHQIPAVAIRLGEMRMIPIGGHLFRVRLRFPVPKVPAGMYHVQYCNDPCTVDGIGDLIGGGSIAIGATRTEARLLIRTQRLRWKVEAARDEARRQVDTVRSEYQDLDADRVDELRTKEARIEELAGELADTRRALRIERSGISWRPVAGWLGVLAAAFLAAVIGLVRRLRHARIDAELHALTCGGTDQAGTRADSRV